MAFDGPAILRRPRDHPVRDDNGTHPSGPTCPRRHLRKRPHQDS
jgi:hypothetical protein